MSKKTTTNPWFDPSDPNDLFANDYRFALLRKLREMEEDYGKFEELGTAVYPHFQALYPKFCFRHPTRYSGMLTIIEDTPGSEPLLASLTQWAEGCNLNVPWMKIAVLWMMKSWTETTEAGESHRYIPWYTYTPFLGSNDFPEALPDVGSLAKYICATQLVFPKNIGDDDFMSPDQDDFTLSDDEENPLGSPILLFLKDVLNCYRKPLRRARRYLAPLRALDYEPPLMMEKLQPAWFSFYLHPNALGEALASYHLIVRLCLFDLLFRFQASGRKVEIHRADDGVLLGLSELMNENLLADARLFEYPTYMVTTDYIQHTMKALRTSEAFKFLGKVLAGLETTDVQSEQGWWMVRVSKAKDVEIKLQALFEKRLKDYVAKQHQHWQEQGLLRAKIIQEVEQFCENFICHHIPKRGASKPMTWQEIASQQEKDPDTTFALRQGAKKFAEVIGVSVSDWERA